MKQEKEKKEREKWSLKKRLVLLAIIALIIVMAAAITIFILLINQRENRNSQRNTYPQASDGMVIASGTTVTDSVIEKLDIDSLESSLYVEDIYVSSGQSVKAGDKILKITDDSLTKTKKELNQEAQKAQIAYEQQLVTFEESKIEAKRDADIQVISAKYADTDYAYNLKQALDQLDELEEQVADAKELVDEYTKGTETDYYYTYYQVKELQDEANENFTLLMKLYEEWNISDSSSGSSGMSFSSGSGAMGGMGAVSGDSQASQKSSVYSDFDDEVTEETKEWKDAVDNYESAKNKAEYSLEDAKAQYEILNAKLVKQQTTFEKEKITLKTTCDSTKAQAELSESSYETDLKKLQEELDLVEDENNEAKDNLANFEERLGDGYLYASSDGTIMMVNAKKDNAINLSMPLVAYTDTESVTISVSVEQEDISKIQVGSTAIAMIDELGNYEGEVTSINPISSSDSRSSVSYEVIVTLTGDLTGLSSNLTATVMIGDNVSPDMMQNNTQMQIEENEGKDMENSENNQRPDMPMQRSNENTQVFEWTQ